MNPHARALLARVADHMRGYGLVLDGSGPGLTDLAGSTALSDAGQDVDGRDGAAGSVRIGRCRYAVEVFSGSRAAVHRAAVRLAGAPTDAVGLFVVAPYIAADGERLAHLGVAYCDASGNAHIHQPGLVIEVSGPA